MFQRCSHTFLYFKKYFGDKYGVRGSRLSGFVGSSGNHPKNIAIDQEVKISHCAINKTPIIILKNTEKQIT